MQALIEKDWLAFGHPFADRVGMSTVTGSCSIPSELPRQSSTGSIQSSPMRQPSASFTSQPPTSHAQNNYSPIFLQVRIVMWVYDKVLTHYFILLNQCQVLNVEDILQLISYWLLSDGYD